MSSLVKLTKRFIADEEGAAFIEYTVLLALVLLGVLLVIASAFQRQAQIVMWWHTWRR